MKLLHVIATPRSGQSNSLRISEAFLQTLAAHRPDLEVEVVDLFATDLPALAGDNIDAKYTLLVGQPIDPGHAESWRQIETLIGRFLSADAYLLSVPMWNFGIPYALKYYIDCLVQPGYVFRFNEVGMPVPMVHGKKMVCVTARGADYSAASPMRQYDFQQPYLRAIFGFIGVTDLEFLDVQPTDISALRDNAMAQAEAHARHLAGSPEWVGHGSPDPRPLVAVQD